MGHDIEQNVDGERIGDLLREAVEIEIVLTFSFPAIAQVRVVANEHHDAAVVIGDCAVVRSPSVTAIVGPLPFISHARLNGIFRIARTGAYCHAGTKTRRSFLDAVQDY